MNILEAMQFAGAAVLATLALVFTVGMAAGIAFSQMIRRNERRQEKAFERFLHRVAREGSELIDMERRAGSHAG